MDCPLAYWVRWIQNLLNCGPISQVLSVYIEARTHIQAPLLLHGFIDRTWFRLSMVYGLWHLFTHHGVVSCIHGLHDLCTHPRGAPPTLGAHHLPSKHWTSSSTVLWCTVPSGSEIPVFGERWLYCLVVYVYVETIILCLKIIHHIDSMEIASYSV